MASRMLKGKDASSFSLFDNQLWKNTFVLFKVVLSFCLNQYPLMVTIQLTLSSECIGRKSKVLMDFMRLLILLPPRPTMNEKFNGGAIIA